MGAAVAMSLVNVGAYSALNRPQIPTLVWTTTMPKSFSECQTDFNQLCFWLEVYRLRCGDPARPHFFQADNCKEHPGHLICQRVGSSGKGPLLRVQKHNFGPCCALGLKERCYEGAAVQGTRRDRMEDTYSIVVDPSGSEPAFFGVYDGHGGSAVAEMLKTSLWPVYKKKLAGRDFLKETTAAYLEVDQLSLAQPKGMFGALRERGLGGSKCGATAATVVLLPRQDDKKVLVAANVGDARVVLVRDGQAIQLTVDHKPDVEEERKRIEARNPTPKKPLVVNVGGIWRVGGLLALSRAFGDVYLKDWTDDRANGARGGFGLTAEPYVTVETITPEDQMIILGTDGLWELGNQEVVDICLAAGENTPLDQVMKNLINVAQEKGVTDDIAGIVIRL